MSESKNAEAHKGRLLSTIKFPIRWGDMDSLGHVNNAQYLRYFEESRVDWTQRNGLRLHSEGEGMILLKAGVTYKKSVVYPANVTIDLFAGPIGNTSLQMINELTIEGDARPAAIGEFVIVWFDYNKQKPAPVPQRLRDLLEGRA
ncbi:MAG TPA: thioesterase family protein [Usitatibacteraceae bacterium]